MRGAGPATRGSPVPLHRVLAGGGDALIVVPPFAQIGLAALGAHLLQACAAEAGFRVRILYGSLLFAARVGADRYDAFCREAAFVAGFPGERVFARAAHGLPPLGRHGDDHRALARRTGEAKAARLRGLDLLHPPLAPRDPSDLLDLDRHALAWAEETAEAVAGLGFPVVGCSASFDQTNASFALLKALRRRQPGVVTVVGGGNCFGEMAAGVASLDPGAAVVDHVLEGECEATFPAFLAGLREGRRPAGRVVPGLPARLDDLPDPRYDDFEAQLAAFLPGQAADPSAVDVVAETSRGCWRGERGHCTFCGLNGSSRAFRRRDPGRAVAALGDLARRHPGRTIFLADTILPPAVLPPLAAAPPGAPLHLCVPPRVPLAMARRLRDAGVRLCDPGFEALDTSFLAAMDKGTTAADVVSSLRNLRSFGIHPFWNLLWGLPGEDPEGYRRSVERMPLLHHLAPPRMAYHVSVDRACPYHLDPGRWGIRDLRPLPSYGDVFPEGTDLPRIASHFTGDWDCAAYDDPDRVRALLAAMDDWVAAWRPRPPDLKVLRLGRSWVLGDTRACAKARGLRRLSGAREARRLLEDRPRDRSAWQADLLAEGLALALDGRFVPLACAAPEDLEALGIGHPSTGADSS